MKRILAITLVLMFLFCACAEDMVVVNCQEWVSLRVAADTKSARLAEVPLGATVTNCSPYDREFTYCEYNGQSGYILNEYLMYLRPAGDTNAAEVNETGITPDMIIANCTEAVSMFAWADPTAPRLMSLEPGTSVTNCRAVKGEYADSGFVYCEFGGNGGFVSQEYLIPVKTESAAVTVSDNGVRMTVVNCDSWVSLRVTPSTKANRACTVPLGAIVDNCVVHNSEFTYCEYNGFCGYILSKYLAPIATEPAESTVPGNETAVPELPAVPAGDNGELIAEVDGLSVYAKRLLITGSEKFFVTVFDGSTKLWEQYGESDMTELTMNQAFVGGTADAPIVYVHFASTGLFAYDLHDGTRLWQIGKNEQDFGASLTALCDDNGTIYITGYYGPDPVAVDRNGAILWTSDTGSNDIFWPYRMRIENGLLYVLYDSIGSEVAFDLNDGSVR